MDDHRNLYRPTTEFKSDFVPTRQQEDVMIAPLGPPPTALPTPIINSNPIHDLATMAYITNIPLSIPEYKIEQIMWVSKIHLGLWPSA